MPLALFLNCKTPNLTFLRLKGVNFHVVLQKKRRPAVDAAGLMKYVYEISLLMCRPKQIVDCLDRIEGFGGYLDEDSRPVAHRSVPQSGQFESFEFAAGI